MDFVENFQIKKWNPVFQGTAMHENENSKMPENSKKEQSIFSTNSILSQMSPFIFFLFINNIYGLWSRQIFSIISFILSQLENFVLDILDLLTLISTVNTIVFEDQYLFYLFQFLLPWSKLPSTPD